MKILIAVGISGEEYEVGGFLVEQLKALGHEVCTAGPVYGRTDISHSHPLKADIDLPDKPHPETYTYKEVLDKAPWTPDFVLQIEAHFYFVGDKPKGVKSYYWVHDPHRGGVGHRDMAMRGTFDAVFITHMFFAKPYLIKGIKCFLLPFAFSPERIKHDPSMQPECDISFPGQTGIHPDDIVYGKIDGDGFEYCSMLPDNIRFLSQYGEYWERAMLLRHLMKHFDVRLYKRYPAPAYARILQKGKIGFHRSTNNIPPRLFQNMACRRATAADYVLGIEEMLTDGEHVSLYDQFQYNPSLSNFLLDCEQAELCVYKLLNKHDMRKEIAEKGYEHVHKHHTYRNRADRIIERAEGGV